MFLANFSNTNAAKPSFFEMVAQQQMMPTLKPALKYLLTVWFIYFLCCVFKFFCKWDLLIRIICF